ncbi:MAG: hypothetical protein EBZ59_05470 [Planctomycetia bacterium]|nr:hypothetical protein [Planctomycetia bacterium]
MLPAPAPPRPFSSPENRLADWWRRTFTLDPRSLAAFRMAIGAILCADALLRTRDFSLMFAPDGMFPLAALRAFRPGVCVWSLAFCVDAAWWGGIVLALEGLAGAAMVAGLGGRAATVLGWVAVVSVIRRTAPAANAGDLLLACLLFWGMFLPLGATWSCDAARRARDSGPPSAGVLSAASTALVLQIVAIYLAAGLAKCNESWLSGTAVTHALSVHDHGGRLGQLIASSAWWTDWLARPVTWLVLAMELACPLLVVAFPGPRTRLTVAVLFMLFHATISVVMTVGLFGYVGMAAWLPMLPSIAWSRRAPALVARDGRRTLRLDGLCAAAGCLAAVSFAHECGPWRSRPLHTPLAAAIDLCCLSQEWAMFGEVPAQEQWVYGRAELADGSVVDVLRDGRPLETVRPDGGFLTLAHHRWHKMFWELPRPPVRIFAPSIAAAIAGRWNARHGREEQVRSLEIRYARLGKPPSGDALHELLLATWPPRDASGRGNLDRFLHDARAASGPDDAAEIGRSWASGVVSGTAAAAIGGRHGPRVNVR